MVAVRFFREARLQVGGAHLPSDPSQPCLLMPFEGGHWQPAAAQLPAMLAHAACPRAEDAPHWPALLVRLLLGCASPLLAACHGAQRPHNKPVHLHLLSHGHRLWLGHQSELAEAATALGTLQHMQLQQPAPSGCSASAPGGAHLVAQDYDGGDDGLQQPVQPAVRERPHQPPHQAAVCSRAGGQQAARLSRADRDPWRLHFRLSLRAHLPTSRNPILPGQTWRLVIHKCLAPRQPAQLSLAGLHNMLPVTPLQLPAPLDMRPSCCRPLQPHPSPGLPPQTRRPPTHPPAHPPPRKPPRSALSTMVTSASGDSASRVYWGISGAMVNPAACTCGRQGRKGRWEVRGGGTQPRACGKHHWGCTWDI